LGRVGNGGGGGAGGSGGGGGKGGGGGSVGVVTVTGSVTVGSEGKLGTDGRVTSEPPCAEPSVTAAANPARAHSASRKTTRVRRGKPRTSAQETSKAGEEIRPWKRSRQPKTTGRRATAPLGPK
jgi:hypothetical protein